MKRVSSTWHTSLHRNASAPGSWVRECKARAATRLPRVLRQQRPSLPERRLLLHHQLRHRLAGEELLQDVSRLGRLGGEVLEQGFGEEEVVVQIVGTQGDGFAQLGDSLVAVHPASDEGDLGGEGVETAQ